MKIKIHKLSVEKLNPIIPPYEYTFFEFTAEIK